MTGSPWIFTHSDYTVGWICALPETELVAVMASCWNNYPRVFLGDELLKIKRN
ncbi:hypothetical protein BDW75DRAFT_223063 [Aspergillus navahoensis]